jgi:hypothetical protein
LPGSKPSPLRAPLAFSRTHPFVTVLLSDLQGPSRRQRLVLRERSLPDWLRQHATLLAPGHDWIVAAMGKASLGSRTCIRSIVVYPARADAPEMAYVYVAESEAAPRAAREAAPVHVVRCKKLPKLVRFVEVPQPAPVPRPALRAIEVSTMPSHDAACQRLDNDP